VNSSRTGDYTKREGGPKLRPRAIESDSGVGHVGAGNCEEKGGSVIEGVENLPIFLDDTVNLLAQGLTVVVIGIFEAHC
jgi:hypothetical protein